MKIFKDKDELVVRIPLTQKRNNPYDDEESKEDVPALIGVVAGMDYSISHLNDLSYKGDIQEGSRIIMFDTEEELREICKKFGLDVWEHPICDYCKKPIYGTFTLGELGNQCYGCELEEKTS